MSHSEILIDSLLKENDYTYTLFPYLTIQLLKTMLKIIRTAESRDTLRCLFLDNFDTILSHLHETYVMDASMI